MREIKSRAYIKKSKKMVDVKSIHFGTKKIIVGYSKSKTNYGNYSVSFDEIELMQFIGLYDKNGKEIYEGDIVRIKYRETTITGIIEYSGYGFFCSTDADTWELDEYYEIEVIGNIYDNPELLKEN